MSLTGRSEPYGKRNRLPILANDSRSSSTTKWIKLMPPESSNGISYNSVDTYALLQAITTCYIIYTTWTTTSLPHVASVWMEERNLIIWPSTARLFGGNDSPSMPKILTTHTLRNGPQHKYWTSPSSHASTTPSPNPCTNYNHQLYNHHKIKPKSRTRTCQAIQTLIYLSWTLHHSLTPPPSKAPTLHPT